MIWIIIEFIFPALLIALPLSLYRSNRLFMAKFYLRMTASGNARKLYVRCMLILILLYHYIYAGGHFGEWGILVSTILCAILFPFKRADKWLAGLHEEQKRFFLAALLALAICAVPHLHTTAVTLGFLLWAAMFYPSCNVLSKWEDEETKKQWCKNPRTLSEYYY